MAEILFLQDRDPPFPLASWILSEEGHTVRQLSEPRDAIDYADDPPPLAIINIGLAAALGRDSAVTMRALLPGTALLHIASSADPGCPCDICAPPPHTGPKLLSTVRKLLDRVQPGSA